MSARLRIAFGRIAQETNAMSPVPTTLADFARCHWLEGDALLEACKRGAWEAAGFVKNAELTGFVDAVRRVGRGRVDLVPLFSAWAIPGGRVSADAFRGLADRLVGTLREAGPIDGLFLSLHGAMAAEGVVDAETALLAEARAVIGPVPIGASFDLHGHMRAPKVRAVDVLACYRTNPHRDHERTGFRAGSLLIRTLLGEVHPRRAWRSLPMVLGGGRTVDLLAPMRAIFQQMSAMERDPHVLDVSLFMCHPWADAPDLGWAVHVTTDDRPALAEQLADQLADAAWSVRHALPPEMPSASEAIRTAREAWWRRRLGTVCISDVSDMVGAGAPGDNPRLVRALLEEGEGLLSYAPICDPDTVAALWDVAEGSEVRAQVGGRLSGDHPPIPVSGTRRRGRTSPVFGRMVVLDLGHVQLVVTERPPWVIKPAFYRDMGLDPVWADICIVKSLFPFRIYFALHNRLTLYARTSGATDLDAVRRLAFDGPVHPQQVVEGWRDADRRRRGLAG